MGHVGMWCVVACAVRRTGQGTGYVFTSVSIIKVFGERRPVLYFGRLVFSKKKMDGGAKRRIS
jgi:hypothetical protein